MIEIKTIPEKMEERKDGNNYVYFWHGDGVVSVYRDGVKATCKDGKYYFGDEMVTRTITEYRLTIPYIKLSLKENDFDGMTVYEDNPFLIVGFAIKWLNLFPKQIEVPFVAPKVVIHGETLNDDGVFDTRKLAKDIQETVNYLNENK